MHYKFSSKKPHTHYIDVELVITGLQDSVTIVNLPVWRPGRYELGNFAKNIKRFEVSDLNGNALPFSKKDKSSWIIENGSEQSFIISYSYYANQPDAGACFCNEDQLYVNPVHCCLYVHDKIHDKHTVELNIPYGWNVATSLKRESGHTFCASDFDELADSPFIASSTLKHFTYKYNSILFHVWIEGHYIPDADKLINDFMAFTKLQIDVMQHFPAEEYHFLIQALPFKFYHGVEHLKSTVLALGPAEKLNEKDYYKELLGVASHELFHVWNVKSIRPAEMMPYHFSKENYASTGYVYEGVTTYYGDLFLRRCNFFSDAEYFAEIEKRLLKHVSNEGRFNHSVAQSSFDTWLDGYVPGVPGRKVSIYDEGSLIALMLDIMIIDASETKHSLDDVMKLMHKDFGQKHRGYKDSDFRQACEYYYGKSLTDFFDTIIYKATDYTETLNQVLDLAGCRLKPVRAQLIHESDFGLKIKIENGKILVTAVATDSPADNAGIGINDELLLINHETIEAGQGSTGNETNLDYLLSKYEGRQIEMQISSFYKKKTIRIQSGSNQYFGTFKIVLNETTNAKQQSNFNFWLSQRC